MNQEWNMKASAVESIAGDRYRAQQTRAGLGCEDVNQVNPTTERDASTLTKDIDRLNGIMRSIGDDLVAIHVAMFRPEPVNNGLPLGAENCLMSRMAFILMLGEAVAQETASLRRRIG